MAKKEFVDVVNKVTLINTVADTTDMSKTDVTTVFNAIFDEIFKAVKEGKKVSLNGLMNFEPTVRAARKGINPKTKESIVIPESKTVTVKVAKAIKEMMK